jgi:hypothetical protein
VRKLPKNDLPKFLVKKPFPFDDGSGRFHCVLTCYKSKNDNLAWKAILNPRLACG